MSFLQKNITFALICPPIDEFPYFTLDARSSDIYNLYAHFTVYNLSLRQSYYYYYYYY